MGAGMVMLVGKHAGKSQGVCPACQKMSEHFQYAR